ALRTCPAPRSGITGSSACADDDNPRTLTERLWGMPAADAGIRQNNGKTSVRARGFHRLAGTLDDLGRQRIEVGDDLLHAGAGQRIDLAERLVGVLQEVRIAHGV